MIKNPKKYHIKTNSSGFSLILLVILIASFIALTTAIVVIINNQNKIASQINQYESALSLAELGIQQALQSLEKDTNWSDNAGTLFDNVAYLEGHYTVILSDATTHNILIKSTGKTESSEIILEKQVSRAKSVSGEILDSYYMSISTENAMTISPANIILAGIGFMNNHVSKNITLDKISISWLPNNDEAISQIYLNGSPLWPGGLTTAGTFMDLTNYSFIAGQSDYELKVYFNNNMAGKNFDFFFYYTDGSCSAVNVSPTEGIAMSDFLILDTTQAKINDNTKLIDLKLNNSHPSSLIWLTKMKIYLEPNNNQKINKIYINGSEVFSGVQSQNSTFNIIATTLNASVFDHKIYFDNAIVNATFNMTYIMQDNTSTTNRFKALIPQSQCFQANTQNVVITPQSNPLNLTNLRLSNISADQDYTITHFKPIWTPNNNQKLKTIKINGQTVYSDTLGAVSGDLIDINDFTINKGITNLEQICEFDNFMMSKDFSFTYVFADASSTTLSILLNPASWLAGDNFETGNFWGGSHFTGPWIAIFGNVSIISDIQTYSGKYSMSLKGVARVIRAINLAGHENQRIRFCAKITNFTAGNQAYFEVSEDACFSWTTLKTWSSGDLVNYTYQEFDLSSFWHSMFFFIRFRTNADSSGHLYIDDLFFY